MSEESAEATRCSVCDADLDGCDVCDELPCGQGICLRCLSLVLGLRVPEPHTHGG